MPEQVQFSTEDLTRLLNGGLAVYEYYYPNATGKALKRLGSKMISPFQRNGKLEKDESFSVYWHRAKGMVFFKDYGAGLGGSHWQFVMDLFGCDWKEAVDLVKRDVLGMFDGQTITKTYKLKTYEASEEQQKSRLEPLQRPWKRSDLDFYKEAGISTPTLHKSHTYPIESYKIHKPDGKIIDITCKTPTFALRFPSGRHKIYAPFTDNPRFKWVSDLVADEDVFMADQIGECDFAFLLAGNRDTQSFVENIGFPGCALASESANLPVKFRAVLERKAKRIYVLYDNDKQGWKKAIQFHDEYGYKPLNAIYSEFKGTGDNGEANDFVDFFKHNPGQLSRFKEILEDNL